MFFEEAPNRKSFKLNIPSYSLEQFEVRGKKFSKSVFAIQLFGALMFAVVCIAYILGLPTNTVLHGELSFRIVLSVFGSVFFVSSIAMLVVTYLRR
jgi:hypothetical protein